MISRRTYRDQPYEEIFRAQHNRSISLEHDGFTRLVHNLLRTGFIHQGTDAPLVQYIQNLATTDSICRNSGSPQIDPKIFEQRLEKHLFTIDNHRCSGHLKIIVTDTLEIWLNSVKLPTESSIYLLNERETMFLGLFKPGLPVQH